MLAIAALDKLVHEFSRLPGVGPKSAQRLAYFVLKSHPGQAMDLAQALARVHQEVHPCPRCYNFTDKELCHYCTEAGRMEDVLCVVEEPSDILKIEGSGAFRGRYHVLHGTLSPLDGVGPSDLRIGELIDRIDAGLNGKAQPIREIILALDADLEGDTTILYLSKLLKDKKVRLSRIAHGVPIGGDIDFVDDRTMNRALENRIEIESR
jgi:recombination protein RecR